MATTGDAGGVTLPASRRDVIRALEVLAAPPPVCTADGRDPRAPGLSDAVAWLLEDTFWAWSRQGPMASVGTILRSEREALVVGEAVGFLCQVSVTNGPETTDAQWFRDSDWPLVRQTAAAALSELST